MEKSRTVQTLQNKLRQIEDTIASYEKQIEQARADLAHVIAVIRVFQATDDPAEMPAYADLHRVFKRTQQIELCRQALAQRGPQTTAQLAAYVMEARGLDPADQVMRRAVMQRLVNALVMQMKRGKLRDAGRVKTSNQRIWALV
ncbi:MAG: hypothetical protein AB7O98_18005 [Hyphomonadaceae bacterium]